MQTAKTVEEVVALSGRRVYVAVDIGGTNARVAVTSVADDGTPASQAMTVLKTNEMAKMLAFLAAFETAILKKGAVVLGASVAGPGPRNAEGTRLGPFSNYTKACQVLNKADLPQRAFPADKTVFLNDLEAAAYGIVALSQRGDFSQYFKKMWGPHDAARMRLEQGPYLVLAVGTGCGAALVHKCAAGVQVIPMEFGHTSIVAEREDRAFLDSLSDKIYGTGKNAEYEDVVAGRGLVACYEWQARGKAVPALSDPGAVSKRAAEGCPVAREAMHVHYKYVVGLTSDLAMGFVLGGVVLAGDNIVHNKHFVADDEACDKLEKHFKSHTMDRFGFQSRVDMYRQDSLFSFNLEGGFYKAREAGRATPKAKL